MDQLQHFSHPHPLLLSLDEYRRFCALCRERVSSRTPCYKCNEDGCKYFYMHISCAELPYQLHHPGHPKHDPLTLMKTNLGDQCDNCRTRQTNLFHQHRSYMYTCSLYCLYPAHLECILGEFPNIKFGKTRTIDNHQHPLALAIVSKTSDDGRHLCEVCGYSFTLEAGLAYECAECKFNVHRRCLYKIGTSKG
ncbi:uncharacterized protein LOC122317310 isoform X2 [Carya illinoinensis]|uniref:uncharacterized protein LOC122317310 isoform X2 n=1 Tax=Carya illinoinensis TaxID=32201 RepID=UPI001C722BD6|nr:uncharacterized protein LOC122317310 isoform X2 [Carya illinoinensis]